MVSLYVAAASSTAAMSFALKYILSFGRFTFVMLLSINEDSTSIAALLSSLSQNVKVALRGGFAGLTAADACGAACVTVCAAERAY